MEDALQKGMATYSSIPAWRSPWTEEPSGLRPWVGKEVDVTEPLTLSLSHSKALLLMCSLLNSHSPKRGISPSFHPLSSYVFENTDYFERDKIYFHDSGCYIY